MVAHSAKVQASAAAAGSGVAAMLYVGSAQVVIAAVGLLVWGVVTALLVAPPTPRSRPYGMAVNSKNVVVLYCTYKRSWADRKSPEAQTVGEGDGFVLTNGGIIPIKWSRADQKAIVAANQAGDRATLKADSYIPLTMAIIFLALLFYFKSIGGYRALKIEEQV